MWPRPGVGCWGGEAPPLRVRGWVLPPVRALPLVAFVGEHRPDDLVDLVLRESGAAEVGIGHAERVRDLCLVPSAPPKPTTPAEQELVAPSVVVRVPGDGSTLSPENERQQPS